MKAWFSEVVLGRTPGLQARRMGDCGTAVQEVSKACLCCAYLAVRTATSVPTVTPVCLLQPILGPLAAVPTLFMLGEKDESVPGHINLSALARGFKVAATDLIRAAHTLTSYVLHTHWVHDLHGVQERVDLLLALHAWLC
jgi:hypothetical protein